MNKIIRKAKWQGCELVGSRGQRIAVRCKINGQVRLFYYGKYEKYKDEIEQRKDTYEIADEGDLLGNLGSTEWEDLLCDIRERKRNMELMAADRQRIAESSDNKNL